MVDPSPPGPDAGAGPTAAPDPGPSGHPGFLVHGWADSRGRMLLAGRLSDGRSFAVVENRVRPDFLIRSADVERASEAAARARLEASFTSSGRRTLAGEPCDRTEARDRGELRRLEEAFGAAGIPVYEADVRAADRFLAERRIRGGLVIRGTPVPGRFVDAVFLDPDLEAAEVPPALRTAALDIETDVEAGTVLAVSLAGPGLREVLFLDEAAGLFSPDLAGADPAARNPSPFEEADDEGRTYLARPFSREADLLRALGERIRALDPDLITGWNVVDFDLAHLSRRCQALAVPFRIGRTEDPADIRELDGGRRYAASIPGRQAVDALKLARGAGRFEDLTLDSVAREVLGTGKSVESRGRAKIEELSRLRSGDPAAFRRYCLADSELVLAILDKTGLLDLTLKRAQLTGTGIDLAWTSIPAFERIYLDELMARGYAAAPKVEGRRVSGAAGGTILEPRPGLFRNVLVFDFRSLYPSVMRTFNVDPLAFRLAAAEPRPDDLEAPNGARFRREPGILPAVIERYFAERLAAIERGDETASYVYKILMNSFYGVLGAEGCRYADTALAGAVTSYGRKWLHWARDWFAAKGFRVLYGDTDSAFVDSGLPEGALWGALDGLGRRLAPELNADLAAAVRDEYGLESRMELKFEKVYARFFIPPLRSRTEDDEEGDEKGRAKGYAGFRLGPEGGETEVKGMEAARRDGTALARELQVETMDLVFRDAPPARIEAHVRRVLADLRAGLLDDRLVYRKALRRTAAAYTKVEPPHVRAARILGWTDRRGVVEYRITKAGAEPVGRETAPLDYEHYAQRQLRPAVDALLSAAGMDPELIFGDRPQLELGL
ncbi:MAG TPA: DNA polymerase II [Spirochaetia bacterium]|nr:DNA polymerase II [Spirochaetales bacterium]HRY81556.1 DNA polymerase II [Spirochaetia bacterium]